MTMGSTESTTTSSDCRGTQRSVEFGQPRSAKLQCPGFSQAVVVELRVMMPAKRDVFVHCDTSMGACYTPFTASASPLLDCASLQRRPACHVPSSPSSGRVAFTNSKASSWSSGLKSYTIGTTCAGNGRSTAPRHARTSGKRVGGRGRVAACRASVTHHIFAAGRRAANARVL